MMVKKLLWKDPDFIVFSNDGVNEKRFYEEMAAIGQKLFGTPDDKIFEAFKTPIGFEKKRRDSDGI